MSKISLIAHTTMALAIAVSLSACGGGGGNTKSDAPSGGGVVVPPNPNPNPSVPKCENIKASNYGVAGACEYVYTSVKDNLLYGSRAAQAQDEGYTGKGVKVAVLDTQMPTTGTYAPLDGRVKVYEDFVPNKTPDGVTSSAGHGSIVSSIVGGKSTSNFNGGVAPDVDLYWGRVCSNGECSSQFITEGVRSFTNAGVRLFNMSIAGVNNSTSAYPYYEMGNLIKKVDGIAVVATGNSGTREPGLPAALPEYLATVKDNWLVVANGVINESGPNANIVELHKTSNLCGSSMSYCLTAPGNISMPGTIESGKTGTVMYNGTSMAAGVVTGVSALVWGAYPWMSASNVQQTVLTTATDLGDAGVDAVYGWGAVNAQKAVYGPAQFTKNFSADVTSGYNSVFTNDISGVGGLVKSGAGSLTLTGKNTYSGLTSVNDGVLSVNGSLAGSVENNASFYANNASVAGNYTAFEKATTGIVLGTTLNVSGKANVDGTLLVLAPASTYTVKSTEKLLSAGSVSGEFDQVTYANDLFWKADVAYSATEVSAAMSRTSAATAAVAFAMDQSVVDGAKQVDQVVAELDKRYENGGANVDVFATSVAGLMASSTESAASSMSTLTGSIHGSARSAVVSSELGQLSSIADHIAASDSTERNVWVQAETTDGSVKRMGYATTNWDRDGVTVGVDMPLGQWSVGAVGNSSNLDLKSVADRLEADQMSVYVWAHKDFGKAYTTAVAGATRSKVETSREIVVTDTETTTSRRTDQSSQIRFETGYAFGSIAPFVAAGAVSSKQDGFQENNTSGWGLVAKSDTATIGFAEAGVRVSGDYGKWFYTGSAVYQNVFSGRSLNYVAAFGGLDEVGFDVVSPSVSKERFRAVLHGGYNLTPSVSVFGQITGETGSGQASRTAVELGARLAF